MSEQIPRFKVKFNEESEMTFISIVKDPAVQIKGLRFSHDIPQDKIGSKQLYFSKEKDQQFIVSVIARPNFPMLQFDNELGYFEVEFDGPEIRKMADHFMSKSKAVKINMDHKDPLTSGYIAEAWFVENEYDKAMTKYGFQELEPDTWVGRVNIPDPKEWEEIKKGDRASFSLEGFFDMEVMLSEVKKELKQKLEMENKTKLKFKKLSVNDGLDLFIQLSNVEGEGHKVGDEVFILNDELEKIPAPDGEYREGTVTYVVKDGKVSEIKEDEKPEEKKEDAPVEAAEEPAPATETPAATPALDEAAILAIVQPKLDELIAMIAEVKNIATESKSATEVQMSEVKLSKVDLLTQGLEAAKKLYNK